MHRFTDGLTAKQGAYRIKTVALTFCMLLGVLPANADAGASGQSGQWRNEGYTRVERNYAIPDVSLRDRYDQAVPFRSLLAEHRPVVLQFIFTSCQSICPLLTSTAAQAQDKLREVNPNTRIISISIDPDHDTPKRLKAYAERFGASGDWYFLTGDRGDINTILSAFDATLEGGNKMNHKPYTYMRPAGASQWVRLTGLGGASQLVAEYRDVLE